MGHRSITISDNKAIFAWVFMAVWMSFLAVMTAWAFWPPVDLLRPAALLFAAVFLFLWVFGLVGSAAGVGKVIPPPCDPRSYWLPSSSCVRLARMLIPARPL